MGREVESMPREVLDAFVAKDAERFPSKPVYADLNTNFLGILEAQATWTSVVIVTCNGGNPTPLSQACQDTTSTSSACMGGLCTF